MLPLIFTLALNAPAPPAPAEGTYTYVSTMNGTTIGKTAITVKHDAGGVVLTESGGGSFNGESGTISDTLRLDETLAPAAYDESAVIDGRTMKASLAFKGNTATETGDAGSKSYDLAATGKHFVVLDFGPFSGWFAFPAQMAAWNDEPAIAIVPAMAHGIPVAPAPAPAAARPKNVPAGDQAIGVAQPVTFTVWYDPKTLVVDRVEIPVQGVVFTRQP